MKRCFTITFIFSIVIVIQATVLSDLAEALPERTWVKLVSSDGSPGNLPLHNRLAYWADSGVWDPIRHKIYFLAENGGDYDMLIYDEASNTWEIRNTPHDGFGHAYDGNALDPSTGTFYFAFYNNTRVKKWNQSSWSELPPVPVKPAPAMGLSWFPDINNGKGGLVYVSGYGRAAWFNGSVWDSIAGALSAPWGSYNVFSEYSPAGRVVWMGGGNGARQVTYRLDAGLNLTRLKDAPIGLGNGSSIHSVDPVSGKYIVWKEEGNTWWEFDAVSDNWSRITNMTGTPSLDSPFQVPISTYGVIMYWTNNYYKDVYIYRHSKRTGPVAKEKTVARVAALEVRIGPNPFNAHTDIQIDCRLKIVDCRLKIYNANGILVEDMTSKIKNLQSSILNQITWNATSRPPGIYIIKLSLGKKVYSKKVMLVK